jgi:hypothetical protein
VPRNAGAGARRNRPREGPGGTSAAHSDDVEPERRREQLHASRPASAARDRRMSGMSRESAVEGRAAERCVVVGYDGSDSARRAVAQSARAAGPRGQVILVTVGPKMQADGIGAEPLVEPRDQPSHLLADARAIAARACATDVRTVAKEGNPAEELLENCPSRQRRSHHRRAVREELSRASDPRLSGRSRRQARALRRPRRRLTTARNTARTSSNAQRSVA